MTKCFLPSVHSSKSLTLSIKRKKVYVTLGAITLSFILLIISLLLWPNSIAMPNPHQAVAQNSTIAINTAKLLAGDAIQALNHKDLNRAFEHLKLIDQHFRQTLVKNSTIAINTAKLLAGDAIQALNHKDLDGGLEHLKLIVQQLGISGNSTPNSNLVSHLRTHISAITSKQSALYTGSEAHAQASITSSNATAAGGDNMNIHGFKLGSLFHLAATSISAPPSSNATSSHTFSLSHLSLPPNSKSSTSSHSVTRMNVVVPKQSSVITQNNTGLAPHASNSSSYLFHPMPRINHLSTNSKSSAPSSGGHHHRINGEDLGKRSKHYGGHCSYSDYKRNVRGV